MEKLLFKKPINHKIALQMFLKPLGENESRVNIRFKLREGSYLIKCFKTMANSGKTDLKAKNEINQLKALGNHIISVLEKNRKVKVTNITFVFL